MDQDKGAALFGQRWLHVFEEDSPRGAVYRPEASDVPLSRRPRERLRLERDGTATLLVPGPDDRMQEQAGTWSEHDDEIVIRTNPQGPAPGRILRVIEWTANRLTVR
jgi:hypothetical protein